MGKVIDCILVAHAVPVVFNPHLAHCSELILCDDHGYSIGLCIDRIPNKLDDSRDRFTTGQTLKVVDLNVYRNPRHRVYGLATITVAEA